MFCSTKFGAYRQARYIDLDGPNYKASSKSQANATDIAAPVQSPPTAPCCKSKHRRHPMALDSLDALLHFAPDYDSPIPYMQRTREYYAAIGYTTPYRWAHYIEAPFTPLRAPLAKSRVTIITTAAPYRADKGDQGPGAPYNGGAKFYEPYSGDTSQKHDLRISHIGYDRVHTTATDSNSWFPLPALH